MPDRDRHLRLVDFNRRAQKSDGLYLHATGAGAYLPIHPFADEPELLAKLHLQPKDCRSVDAYWRVADDVCFLQVWLTKDDSLRRCGFFARWSDSEPPMLNVVAVISAETVTRLVFERAMADFMRMGVPTNAKFAPDIGGRLSEVRE